MNATHDDAEAAEQPIFWDAVWTLDDEWTPLGQPVVPLRPFSGDRDSLRIVSPEFLALL